MFKNILLAYDGSEHANKAAKLAGEMANSLKADLWVVVAYDPIPEYLGKPNFQDAITSRLDHAEEIMKSALEETGSLSGVVRKEIIEGPAAEAILNVAEARNIDLIVMGTRGLGKLVGLLVGSQSQKVVAHAGCPVLLVR
ncbi:MAG: universal stress protein [Omnitrophica WOR_2 bacterium]